MYKYVYICVCLLCLCVCKNFIIILNDHRHLKKMNRKNSKILWKHQRKEKNAHAEESRFFSGTKPFFCFDHGDKFEQLGFWNMKKRGWGKYILRIACHIHMYKTTKCSFIHRIIIVFSCFVYSFADVVIYLFTSILRTLTMKTVIVI